VDVDAEVRRCAEVLAGSPQAELDDLVQELIADGIPKVESEALVALVPMGFAHLVLSNAGVELPDCFLIRNQETGESVRGSLAADSIFQAAKRLASNLLADQSSRRDALRIVAMSSEWTTVRSLCPEGDDFSDLVLTETVLLRVPLEYVSRTQRNAKQ
jgi:hypothetical protein